MKILYDYQMFDAQRFGGISRYFYEIIKNSPEDQSIIGVKYTNNHYLINDEKLNFTENPYGLKKFLPGVSFKGKVRLFRLRNRIFGYEEYPNRNYSIELLKQRNYDVFHPTYYDPYFLDYIGNKPFVLTVHDMIHELYPEFFPNDPTAYNKRKLVEKASHIMVNSEYTKYDLIKFYGVNDSRITVDSRGATLNCNKEIVPSEEIKDIIGKKYFLFTGTRGIYKNFYFFIQSLADFLLKGNENLFIVCTGSPFSKDEKNIIKSLGIEKNILHVFATDNDLFHLYHNAVAFIFPSYYEGFGLPILEAFEAECPVLLANASCFPEIAKDAALYFDPKNGEQIREVCSSVLENDELRQSLVQKGKDRLKYFSWKKCTEKTLSVYRNVLNEF